MPMSTPTYQCLTAYCFHTKCSISKYTLTKQSALLPSFQLTPKIGIQAPPISHTDSQRELPSEAMQPSQCGNTTQIRPVTAPYTELSFHSSETPYLHSVNYGTWNNPTTGIVRRDVKSTILIIAALKINITKLIFHA